MHKLPSIGAMERLPTAEEVAQRIGQKLMPDIPPDMEAMGLVSAFNAKFPSYAIKVQQPKPGITALLAPKPVLSGEPPQIKMLEIEEKDKFAQLTLKFLTELLDEIEA